MVSDKVATCLDDNRDYAEGLALLKELHPKSFAVVILGTVEDDYNQNLMLKNWGKGSI